MTDSVRRRVLASLALAAALPLGAQAQTWPAKPIRIVVGFPAGSFTDTIARAVSDQLSKQLGQPVIVDNKPGANGAIGVGEVARSAPDGYTLGFSAISPLVLNPHLGTPPYDATRDIVPVASVMYSPVLLLGTQAAKERDFRSLLATAKAQPGQVRWATSGLASLGHIMLEHIMQGSGVQITHVPYKGGGQQLNDALSGQFEVLSTNAGPAVMQQIKAGKLHPLAVGAPARLNTLPNVPTLGELGLPAANLNSVFGMFAPAGVPAAVLERLNAEINRALALPDIQARLEASDNVPTGGSAEAFRRQIAAESQSNARIIRAANIRLN